MTFIDAGAGTGKTTRLVHRVVHHVLLGIAPIGEIAVITFTEKAAAELRDRIRVALAAAAAGSPGKTVDGEPSHPEGSEARHRAGEALRALHEAPISTLHSFALRLLEESDITVTGESNLRFSFLDQIDEIEQAAERWQQTAARILSDPLLSDCLDRSVALGIELANWRDTAAELDNNWDRCTLWLESFDGNRNFDPLGIRQPVVDLQLAISTLTNLLRDAGRVAADDKLASLILQSVPEVIDRLNDATKSGDPFEMIHALSGAMFGKQKAGVAKNWSAVRPVDEARSSLRIAEEILRPIAFAAMTPILAAIAQDCVDAARQRITRRTLTFHDVLVAARDLLKDDREACEAARQRYKAIMIDEFQDTDPLQAEIALSLAGDRLTEGALTFVGDPKQSIYRFRRADIAVYQSVSERFGENRSSLTTNRRSTPPIIHFINEVFRGLFEGSEGETSSQVHYEPLQTHRIDPGLLGPAVSVVGGEVEVGSNQELYELEAEAIVGAVAEVIGKWTVVDSGILGHLGDGKDGKDGKDGEVVRVAKPSDVAILIRSRSLLPDLERLLLGAGIPYRIESKGHGWSSQEVVDVRTILGAIDQPADPAAVVAALRSATLGCSDDELYQWRAAGRPWRLWAGDDRQGQVATGLRWLNSLYERKFCLTVSQMVQAVIDERSFLATATTQPRARDSWARLHMVIDAAREFESNDLTATLRRFLERCELTEEQGAVSTERIVAEPDDDAVRILTIHAAKGLEFPITVVAGLGSPSRHDGLRVRWSQTDLGIEPVIKIELRTGEKVVDLDTREVSHKELAKDDKSADDLEAQRLAYVGATRATDHLVLSLFYKKLKTEGNRRLGPDLASALASCESTTVFERLQKGPIPIATPRRIPEGKTPFADLVADPSAQREALAVELQEVGRQVAGRELRTKRASDHAAVAHAAVTQSVVTQSVVTQAVVTQPSGESGGASDGTIDRRFGSAVHAVMQWIPERPSADEITALARDACAQFQLADLERVERCVTVLAGSDAWREATEAPSYWREITLDGTVEGQVVSAIADLVWERTDGTLAVADWKNDRSDKQTLLEKYSGQLLSYARLLELATGQIVSSAVIVAAHPVTGILTEVEVPRSQAA